MNEAKPMTKERREEIGARVVTGEYASHECDHHAQEDILALIAEADYWRGIVRDLPEDVDDSDGCVPPYCLCCASTFVYPWAIAHAPDCAWKLAQ